jgi:hypothetical protein
MIQSGGRRNIEESKKLGRKRRAKTVRRIIRLEPLSSYTYTNRVYAIRRRIREEIY